MFDGYLELDGTEVINRERTVAYLRKYLPNLTIKCEDKAGLWRALREEQTPWVSPSADKAPWQTIHDSNSDDFYGMYPMSIDGIDDSTRQVSVTELSGDGAVHSAPRFGSREIRVRGVMFALNDAGMNSGMAWLRNTLEGLTCGYERQPDCSGGDIVYFVNTPADPSNTQTAIMKLNTYGRAMMNVQTIDGPRVVRRLNPQKGVAWEVEYILSAGIPYAFTFPLPMATTTGVTPNTVGETFCSRQSDAYNDLVPDPYNPTVVHPPRPPMIDTITMPSSWSRYVMNIPQTYAARHGRLVPIINLQTFEAERRMTRVRFMRSGAQSCEYDGEFLITYVPPWSTLTIDAMTRTIGIIAPGGPQRQRPAGNLVMGSNGRPPMWPTMSCDDTYKVVVDTVGGMGGATLSVDVALRE